MLSLDFDRIILMPYRQRRTLLQYNELFDKITFLFGSIQFFILHRMVDVVYCYFVYF